MTSAPADQVARHRALDASSSFIVQAPAGSGKTTLLVDRYLVLLSSVRKPEEIVAITFTRKAAAEMRERVLEKLPNAADIAHRLRIETIDAFCASIARQLPVPAQFGVPPGIVEDADELYREAAAATLALLENRERGDAIRADVWRKTHRVLEALDALGIETPNTSGLPIIEIPLANHEEIDEVGRYLFDQGVYATMAAYPLVPKHEVGFRIQVTAANGDDEIEQLISALTSLKERFQLHQVVSVTR